ncbi:hypothetical protein PT974_01696 [Cladobotryum mycophilum]|uniref:Cyclochlorotine biosynthesis protein O n=1 Tax=Cladobotryum mycophilum TaxID=491253 RepID=A0ABR0SWT6_9HYPO
MAKDFDQRQLLEDGSTDSDDGSEFLPRSSIRGPKQKSSVARSLVEPFIFVFILIVVCIVSLWAGTCIPTRRATVDKTCAARTTQWSPVLRGVAIRYQLQDFNGSFMDENIYRQLGSPEVDKAWEALGVDYRAGVISYEDGLSSGLQSSFVQRAEQYGGGFLVNNLIRKALYFNYDRYKELGKHAFKNEERILRRHVTHCLDTIRQVLMCNVDTAVLGQVWIDPKKPTAFPDFNTKHFCKNYNDIQEWARKLQAPPLDKIPKDYLAPPKPGDVKDAIP